MRQMWMLTAGLAGVLVLAGCGANYHSIFRKFNVDNGDSVVTDANQRVVTNTQNDRASAFVGRIDPKRVVCAEPSPDVAQVISQAFEASISASVKTAEGSEGSGAGALGFATAASAAQLGERLATIQLLRDELSSLCRSCANGAVSSTTYTLRLSRLDRKMVTLLMSEMAAGAFGRELAALGGAASAGGSGAKTAELLAAEQEVRTASETVETERKEFEKAKAAAPDENDQTVIDARTELLDAYQGLATATAKMLSIEVALAGASALSQPVGAPGSIDREGRGEIAAAQLVELQERFLDDDDLGTLIDACVEATNMYPALPRTAEGAVDMQALSAFTTGISDVAEDDDAVKENVFLLKRAVDELNKFEVELQGQRDDLDDLLQQQDELRENTARAQAAGNDIVAFEERRLELEKEVANQASLLERYQRDYEAQKAEVAALSAAVETSTAELIEKRAPLTRFLSELGKFCISDDGLKTVVKAVIEHPDKQAKVIKARQELTAARMEQVRMNRQAAELQLCAAILKESAGSNPSAAEQAARDKCTALAGTVGGN